MKDEMMDEMQTIALEQLQFRRFDVGCREILHDYPGAIINAEWTIQRALERTSLSLKTWLLASPHIADPLEVRFYVSWWDWFKADNFPKWLLKKYPAKQEVKEFLKPYNTYVCPHFNQKWPDASHIKFMMQSPNLAALKDKAGR